MKNFENLLKNFNEKEGIERTTRRLEELNEEQPLNIEYKNQIEKKCEELILVLDLFNVLIVLGWVFFFFESDMF